MARPFSQLLPASVMAGDTFEVRDEHVLRAAAVALDPDVKEHASSFCVMAQALGDAFNDGVPVTCGLASVDALRPFDPDGTEFLTMHPEGDAPQPAPIFDRAVLGKATPDEILADPSIQALRARLPFKVTLEVLR